MKKLFGLALGLLVGTITVHAAIGDRWDARTNFSTSNNPNGPWSYRAWPGLGLMVADSGQHGYGPGWKNPATTYQTIARDWVDANCVGGHSHAALRWTSPVDGWVQLAGYLFMRQDDDPPRVHWFILKQNSLELSRASVKLNPNGTAILGLAGRVTLAEGSGSATALLRRVLPGDTIDMVIENIGGPGHFYGAAFSVEQVAASPAPRSWDAGLDFSAANNPNGVWSYRSYPARYLMSYTANLNGLGAGWYDPNTGVTSIQRPTWVQPNEVGGHSNICLRWTSPLQGRVQVSGHLFMSDMDDRCRVHWFTLEQNGVDFSRGVVKQDPNMMCIGYGSQYPVAILGRAGMVDFSQGDTGSAALIRQVNVGDTLDLVIKENHFYGVAFRIDALDPACGDANHPYPSGDLNRDCKVDMLDFAQVAANPSVDINPLAILTGRVLTAPAPEGEGTIVFEMTDNAAPATDEPYSILFFEDNFDGGKKTAWQDLIGEWGPVWGETYVSSGRLMADAGENTLIVAGADHKWTDQVVSVDAFCTPGPLPGIYVGILLRHNGGHNFILAFYNSDQQRLALYDVNGRGNWGDQLGVITGCPLDNSRKITMVATAIGNQATASITDGLPGHTYSTGGTLTHNLGPGYVGLFHVKENVWCDTAFDNFVAKSPILRAVPVRAVIPASITGVPGLQVNDLVTVTGITGTYSAPTGFLRTITIRTAADIVKQ